VVRKQPLHLAEEGVSREIARTGRFHVSGDGRLYVVYFVSGTGRAGRNVSENRIIEVRAGGDPTPPVVVPLARPFTRFFTATWRSGSPRSDVLDIYGSRAGDGNTFSYARIRIETQPGT
jgi:hypothetical protein